MQIQVLFFGITRDITTKNQLKLDIDQGTTIEKLRLLLQSNYPKLANYTYAIAVNENYAADGFELHQNDQVALIPPVSGG